MTEQKPKLEFDILWKAIIELFIEDFVAFFMPDLYPLVNFAEPPEFWDKELDKIFSDGKPKDVRRCDKLIRLYLKDGKNCWILAHVEVQKELNNNFTKRMFGYFYRIFERYEEESTGIEAIAILLANVEKNKYNEYIYEYNKTKLSYKYRTYDLFAASEEDLIKNKNPFSLVILASRYAVQYKNDDQKKTSFKYKTGKLAFERGYSRSMIEKLLLFTYYIIKLPEDKDKEFEESMKEQLNTMESQTLTFQEGHDYFYAQLHGIDFDFDKYISKERYNIAIEQAKEKEKQAKEKEVQAKEKEEQAKIEKEQTLINSILAFKQIGYETQNIADILKIDLITVTEMLEKHNKEEEKIINNEN